MAASVRHMPPSAQRAEERFAPWKLGGLTVVQLAKRVWNEISEDEVMDRAAALSYYFLFSLFPALLFLTSLLGLLPIPNLMDRLMGYVEQALPGDAASLIQKTLGEIVGGARGGLLSIGALTALWTASNGMASLINTLNVAYDVQEARPWWKRRLLSIGLTIAFSVLLIGAMVLLVFGGTIGQALGNVVGLGALALMVWNIVQWPLAIFFVMLGIALVYYAAPAVEHRKWYWVTPGSLFAVVAWVVMSLGLRFYVANFANYNATYGSIGGVILLMLWLYLTGVVVLAGAELNSEIEAAAARRGAPTAKARGERAPGDASTAASEEARAEAARAGGLAIERGTPVARALAVPYAAVYGGLQLASRAARGIALSGARYSRRRRQVRRARRGGEPPMRRAG
jgi:membrane protein